MLTPLWFLFISRRFENLAQCPACKVVQIKTEGRICLQLSAVMVWHAKTLFLFFLQNHVGHEQMFIHLNYASNYASQRQHCGVSRWQDMKAMPVTLFLPPSLPLSRSHFWHDNTAIQQSGLIMFHAFAPALTAVLSHFTLFDTSLCHQ